MHEKRVGRFIYEVLSGSIKLDRREYLKGDRIWLTLSNAISLYDTGQLKYIRTMQRKSRRIDWRYMAPGETLKNSSMYEIKCFPLGVIRKLAVEEYGFTEHRRYPLLALIREEHRRKRCTAR